MNGLLQIVGLWFVGVLFGGVSVVKTVVWYFHRFETELGDRDSLERYRAEFEKRSRFEEPYCRRLEAGLDLANRYFGQRLLGGKAFIRCWSIAFVYPIVLFLITWGFTGQHTLGAWALLPEGWSRLARAGLVLAFGLYGYGVYWLFKNQEKAARWIKGLLDKLGRVDLLSQFQARTWGFILSGVLGLVVGVGTYLTTGDVAVAVAFAVAFAFAVAGAVAVAFAVAVAVAFPFAVAFAVAVAVAVAGAVAFPFAVAVAVAGALAFAFAVAVAVAIAGAFAVAVAGVFAVAVAGTIAVIFISDVNEGGVTIALFFGLLPLFNALLDFISWAISRRLGRSLQDHYHKYKAFAWWLLDFLIAALLLIGLVFVLAFALEGINTLRGEMVLDLDTLIQQATTDLWGEGFWITTMLLSTLLPTVIHFLFVMASFIAMPLSPVKRAQWLAEIEEVETSPYENAVLSLYTRRKIAERLVLHRVGVFVLSMLACVLFASAVAYLMGAFPQVGGLAEGLGAVAMWGQDFAR